MTETKWAGQGVCNLQLVALPARLHVFAVTEGFRLKVETFAMHHLALTSAFHPSSLSSVSTLS